MNESMNLYRAYDGENYYYFAAANDLAATQYWFHALDDMVDGDDTVDSILDECGGPELMTDAELDVHLKNEDGTDDITFRQALERYNGESDWVVVTGPL